MGVANGGDRYVSTTLSALRGRISEAADRPLFEEAVICFEAGALRASYIMAWISVAESLRTRFSAMAQRGDGHAGKVTKELERLEKQNQATDLHLLDQAKVLGLVTYEQHDKLSHLRGMRNRYAHPTGRGPTEQETLAALEIAVDAVLSQPTLLRHGYADYQLAALFGEPHWLPDDEQAVRENAADVSRRLHPIAAPRLLEGLIEGYEQVFGDPERDTIRRRAGWFLGGFLAEARPDLSEPRWNILEVVRRRPVVASLMLLETLVDDEGLFRLKGDYLGEVVAVALAHGRAEETLGRVSEIVRASEAKREAEDYNFEKGWFNQYDEAAEILSRASRDAAPGKDSLVDALIDAVRSAKPPEELEE